MTTQQMLTGLNCICETTELKIQDWMMEEFAELEATHCVVADPSLMRISASGLSHTNMKVGLFSLFIWRLRALRLLKLHLLRPRCASATGTVYLLSPLHG